MELGLPEEKEVHGVYIARPWPGIGVCVENRYGGLSQYKRYIVIVGAVPADRSPAMLMLHRETDTDPLTVFAEVRDDSALMVLAVIQEILKSPPICHIGKRPSETSNLTR
jgi:hypothetical protein